MELQQVDRAVGHPDEGEPPASPVRSALRNRSFAWESRWATSVSAFSREPAGTNHRTTPPITSGAAPITQSTGPTRSATAANWKISTHSRSGVAAQGPLDLDPAAELLCRRPAHDDDVLAAPVSRGRPV